MFLRHITQSTEIKVVTLRTLPSHPLNPLGLARITYNVWVLHTCKKLSEHMSLVMRKPEFCIRENKGADQLCGNRTTDQHLCFRHTDSTIPLLSKSDLIRNSNDQFSHNQAHIIIVPELHICRNRPEQIKIVWDLNNGRKCLDHPNSINRP